MWTLINGARKGEIANTVFVAADSMFYDSDFGGAESSLAEGAPCVSLYAVQDGPLGADGLLVADYGNEYAGSEGEWEPCEARSLPQCSGDWLWQQTQSDAFTIKPSLSVLLRSSAPLDEDGIALRLRVCGKGVRPVICSADLESSLWYSDVA